MNKDTLQKWHEITGVIKTNVSPNVKVDNKSISQ